MIQTIKIYTDHTTRQNSKNI